jgi:nitronate monooxygenase
MDARFVERFGLRVPVIQAPMAGGPTTPRLVAAVCNAGGLGSVAAAYLSPEQIDRDLSAVRKLTGRPFAVNLFSRDPDRPLEGDVDAVIQWLNREHQRLGIPPPTLPATPQHDFDAQLDAILAHPVAVVSFTFGLLPPARVGQMRGRGIYLVGTATTVREAQALEAAGCDAVVAQGGEAGAHRGTFLSPAARAMIGTVALVPQVADAVGVPVVASGGIMDGRGIVAALALGAAAVQMGTAFLACDEAGTTPAHRRAVLSAAEDQTVVTEAFSGRAARGLTNRFIEEFDAAGLRPLSYPWQNALTRDVRRAAAAADDPGALALWAGQGVRLAKARPAAQLLREWEEEIRRVSGSLLARDFPGAGAGAAGRD